MRTTTDLAAPRCAATLAAALPHVGVTVHAGDGGPTTSVGLDGSGGAPPGAVLLPPCAFRRSVGRAPRAHTRGQSLAMAGLAPGEAPRVRLHIRPPDLEGPAGVIRTERDGEWLHVIATTLPPLDVERLLADPDLPPAPGPWGTWVDPETDVVLAHVGATVGDVVASGRAVDWLVELCARALTEELLAGALGA